MKPREIIVLFGLNGRDALLTDRERERAYREGEKRILEVVRPGRYSAREVSKILLEARLADSSELVLACLDHIANSHSNGYTTLKEEGLFCKGVHGRIDRTSKIDGEIGYLFSQYKHRSGPGLC